ncbi:MAG: type III-B CRISPR-associated protein Cas10/Cmr2, partial [Victivallales bacterium]
VPESRAEEIAKSAEEAITRELQNIGDAVWNWISQEAGKAECSGIDNWKKHWDFQIQAFPQITWAIQPWLERGKCLAEFKKLPLNDESRKDDGKPATPYQRLQDMLLFGEKWLPEEVRDERYYTDNDVRKTLNNPGILWSAHYALVDAKLAARRNTRDFSAWKTEDGKTEHGTPKDSLSGKEEIIGDEKFWEHLVNTCGKDKGNVFTSPGHRYGAMNLIKRLWCRSDKVSYLFDKTKEKIPGFETVEDVAKKNKYGGKYVAILAMDGDDMGKWVSGEKTPEFLNQISADARKYLEPILKKEGKADLRRMLTPSYHLQFSEALANYSTWLASAIVDKFGGQLIYSGGDDVLAMLPADRAIECAETLRSVFRGDSKMKDQRDFHLAIQQDGFVSENAGYPLIVPGKAADVSIGLTIGHCNAPLQMLVKEAQKAEKRAKKEYKKGAIAITVYKRSGEILEWGCKWDCDNESRVALELMRKMTELSSGDNAPVSGRFPYALAGLLSPYELGGEKSIDDGKLKEIILKEFGHVVQQQAKNLEEKRELLEMAGKWLDQTNGKYEDFSKLFLVETFINRARGEN